MGTYNLPFGFTVTAAQQPFLTNFWQPNFLFGSAPPKTRLRFSRLQFYNRLIQIQGFSPSISLIREDRNSNHTHYAYERFRVEGGFVRVFWRSLSMILQLRRREASCPPPLGSVDQLSNKAELPYPKHEIMDSKPIFHLSWTRLVSVAFAMLAILVMARDAAAHSSASPLSCADRSVSPGAVWAPQDAPAFVRCA